MGKHKDMLIEFPIPIWGNFVGGGVDKGERVLGGNAGSSCCRSEQHYIVLLTPARHWLLNHRES